MPKKKAEAQAKSAEGGIVVALDPLKTERDESLGLLRRRRFDGAVVTP
jgi:hypothetical protein